MLRDKDGNLQESPIHGAFELSYASFLVVPRLLMEAMPYEWQKNMVDLVNELNEKFDWETNSMSVSFRNELGHFTESDRNLCNYRRGNSDLYLKDSGEVD